MNISGGNACRMLALDDDTDLCIHGAQHPLISARYRYNIQPGPQEVMGSTSIYWSCNERTPETSHPWSENSKGPS